MFYNGANCDLYIGKGSGKKILKDLDNATKSVKIISPYLSPWLIKKLIDLNFKGIHIDLITSDNIEDDHEKNIVQLIHQNRSTNEKTLKELHFFKKVFYVLLYSLIRFINNVWGFDVLSSIKRYWIKFYDSICYTN